MSRYLNISCGNCKKSISNGYVASGYKSGFGLPYVRCRHCLQLNETGDKLYNDLSNYKKFTFWFYGIIKGIFWGFILGFFLFGIAGLIFLNNINNYKTEWQICSITFAILNTIRILYGYKKAINVFAKAHSEGKYDLYTFNG